MASPQGATGLVRPATTPISPCALTVLRLGTRSRRRRSRTLSLQEHRSTIGYIARHCCIESHQQVCHNRSAPARGQQECHLEVYVWGWEPGQSFPASHKNFAKCGRQSSWWAKAGGHLSLLSWSSKEWGLHPLQRLGHARTACCRPVTSSSGQHIGYRHDLQQARHKAPTCTASHAAAGWPNAQWQQLRA